MILHWFLDPRVADWFLVKSPLPVIAIFSTYLCLIFMGPKWMRNRAPLQLKPLLFVYNAFQVGLSAYMFYEFLVSSYLARYNLTCQPVDFSMDPLALRVIWFLKYFENNRTNRCRCHFSENCSSRIARKHCRAGIKVWSNSSSSLPAIR